MENKTLVTVKDSALFIKTGEVLTGLVYLDQKTHHNVFYKVEMMGTDDIASLLNEIVIV